MPKKGGSIKRSKKHRKAFRRTKKANSSPKHTEVILPEGQGKIHRKESPVLYTQVRIPSRSSNKEKVSKVSQTPGMPKTKGIKTRHRKHGTAMKIRKPINNPRIGNPGNVEFEKVPVW